MKTRNDLYVEKYVKELQDDPVLAAREILGVELAPHERIALRGMWNCNWVYNVWGRGTGKTFMDAVYAALCAVLFPGDKIILLGPGFRQAQLIFKEIESMERNSPMFSDCILHPIKHHTADWTMTFKNGSTIIAVPLGSDGGKIRGLRANRLIIDELVQVPPEIVDRVALPFMATSKNPMSGYLGLEEDTRGNTLVYSTSAYYTFNHAYQRFLNFIEERYGKGNTDYFVTQFNYEDTPDGFINMKVVDLARNQSTDADFRTEWRGEWISDTMGFYPASLLETCKSLAVIPETRGKAGAEYVLGVDPAEVFNNCGFVVIKIGSPFKVVSVEAISDIRYPEICSRILDYMSRFNIVRIGLDRGAGMPVLDLFAEGRMAFDKEGKILSKAKLLEIDDTSGREGRRIIQTVKAVGETVNEINFGMKAAMESGNIKWPAFAGDSDPGAIQEREGIIEEIRQMEAEFRMVEATPTKTGYFSFSVPPHKNKDRYSATLFALAAAKSYVGDDVPALILPSGFWASDSRWHE